MHLFNPFLCNKVFLTPSYIKTVITVKYIPSYCYKNCSWANLAGVFTQSPQTNQSMIKSSLQVGELFSHCQKTNCTMSSQVTIVVQRSQSRHLRRNPDGTFNWCHYHLSKSSIYIKLAHIRKELGMRLYWRTVPLDAAWLPNNRFSTSHFVLFY